MKALFVSSLTLAVAVAACGTPPPDSLLGWDNTQKDALSDAGSTGTGSGSGGGGGGGGGTTGGNGTGSGSGGSGTVAGATGVPCDVATVLAEKCTGCHSDPPINGSLSGLVTYSDLMANSTEDPTKKLIEESVIRMQSTSSPMPPSSLGNPATASDISTLQNWIAAGEPQGTCDAGVVGGGTSNVFSNEGAFTPTAGPSGEHNAGRDCLSCHDGSGEAPHFVFAGTVYNGSGSPVAGAEIRVEDSAGNFTTVYSATNGNFYQRASGNFAAPGHAGARNATTTNLMISSVTNGGCNSCHCTGASCATAPIHLP